MWKRLGFGDATITNEPTIDYNKTSSSFPRTPRRKSSLSTRDQASRLLDDLSTPYQHQDEWDSDDDEEYNRYRFDYTRTLDFNAYDLDEDLQRDTEMIGEWTKESSLKNRYLNVKKDKFDDTHYSLPLRFPGKYQTSSRSLDEPRDRKVDPVRESQVDLEIKKLKKELQQEQQAEGDLMPGASLIPQITELTNTVQDQTKYLSHLKQYSELADNEKTSTEVKYETLKQEYLKELVKMEKLYTCYYNLLEKYVNQKAKN